jgi:ribonuclease BN (tRNA processing enzyme)
MPPRPRSLDRFRLPLYQRYCGTEGTRLGPDPVRAGGRRRLETAASRARDDTVGEWEVWLMELFVLGSAGWIPQPGRMTTALAVRVGDALVLFDAGTGLARLREPRYRSLVPLEGVVFLFLSHLHLDHTVGLTYIPGLWDRPTKIFVPGPSVSGHDYTVIDRLVGPPFFPRKLADLPFSVAVESLEPGAVQLACGGGRVVTVQARRQWHPGGSMGFRMGDEIAFVTDTAPAGETASFVEGVEVLVHEAWTVDERDASKWEGTRTGAFGPEAGRAAHSSGVAAALVAREAAVGELWLSHLPPHGDEQYYALLLERVREIFPRSYLCEDGLQRRF